MSFKPSLQRSPFVATLPYLLVPVVSANACFQQLFRSQVKQFGECMFAIQP